MSTLLDLLGIKLGARFAKLLLEIWLGKGNLNTAGGDTIDVLQRWVEGKLDRRRAHRDLEEVGERLASEFLPLFQDAQRRGQLNLEAIILALDTALEGATTASFFVAKDMEPSFLLTELKRARPIPVGFSQAEEDLYNRALEASVRYLVEISARLPGFEEAFATRSLQQLSNLKEETAAILSAVRQLEAELLNQKTDEKSRSYELDYRLALQRNLDYLELFGIDLRPEAQRQKLSVGYVSLTLAGEEGVESLPAEALFDRLRPGESRFLIRGDAGSGKSTLFRWVAINAASSLSTLNTRMDQETGIRASWRTRIPFLVRLRDCQGGSLPSPDSFPALVASEMGRPPVDWVSSVLQGGRALVLLDGVDEILSSHRPAMKRAIEALVNQYPASYFVVSTRPRAVEVGWLTANRFREARINPMSPFDRQQFVDRWHEAVKEELRSLGKLEKDLTQVASALKKQFDDFPTVARLATNPLLCALICALHRERRSKLPERQRELCEALCHALLHRREQESGLDISQFAEPYRRLDYSQKRAIVQELAYYMIENGESSLQTERVINKVGHVLCQFSGHSAGEAKDVTNSLVERSGILREEVTERISFVHNAFKELLAGDRFAANDDVGRLAERAHDPDWQPVILFAVATDRPGFANRVIERILVEDITWLGPPRSKELLRTLQIMALSCRAVALFIDQGLDKRLNELIAEVFPPRNVEDAGALASSGDSAIPFLLHNPELNTNEAVACVRALRLIGTDRAKAALRSFKQDRRRPVIFELTEEINPLEIEWILASVLRGNHIPTGLAVRIHDLSPLRGGDHDLQNLDLGGTRVSDLSPLRGARQLRRLMLSETQVVDLYPLHESPDLEILDCSKSRISDISPLSGLKNLRHLNLSGTKISDISALGEHTGLLSLDISTTRVSNLSPLAGMKLLQLLHLGGLEEIKIWPPFATLEYLRILNLDNIPIRSLTILSGLRNLEYISLARTKVEVISPLGCAENLRELRLESTLVADVSPLRKFAKLEVLDLGNTPIVDLAPLSRLFSLRELNLQTTQVSDISLLSNLSGLQKLVLWSTSIKDIGPLAGLRSLTTLDLAGTDVSDLSALSRSEHLENLDIRGTKVFDLSPLAELKYLRQVDARASRVPKGTVQLPNLSSCEVLV
jgi:Leucine-rich repeat (LRR) protein